MMDNKRKRGRKAASEPALVYQYRRCIALCQVLAMEDAGKRDDALRHLADVWRVGSIGHVMMIHKLAVVALEAAKEEGE